MAHYLLSIGNNNYTDQGIVNLKCAEHDAVEVYALFGRTLGYKAHKLLAPNSDSVFETLEMIGRSISTQDTFVLYFSGHGMQAPDETDQYLLLSNARLRQLRADNLTGAVGLLSVKKLIEATDNWPSVHRLFLFDACRADLETGKGFSDTPVFGSDKVLNRIAPRFTGGYATDDDSPATPGKRKAQRQAELAHPAVLVKACAGGQKAYEIEGQGGIFTLALQDILTQAAQAGQAVLTNTGWLQALGQKTAELSRLHGQANAQTPWLNDQAAEVAVYVPPVRVSATPPPPPPPTVPPPVNNQLANLLNDFERQLQAGQLQAPMLDSCQSTLARLEHAGLPSATTSIYTQRLEAAIRAAAPVERPKPPPPPPPKADDYSRIGLSAVALVVVFFLWDPVILKAYRQMIGQDKMATAAPDYVPAAEPAPASSSALRAGQLIPTDNCTICPPMVYIEPGVFQMGSPDSDRKPSLEAGLTKKQFDYSLPIRSVTISQGFGLGQTEVTLGQFKQFIKQANYLTEAEIEGRTCKSYQSSSAVHKVSLWWVRVVDTIFGVTTNFKKPGFSQTDNHPVVCVSWKDSHAYIKWLNQQTGNKYGYRLPSEAEWEYAARAGTTTAFRTGDQITTEQANFDGNGTYNGSAKSGKYIAKTSPVGSYSEKKWNLSDMHGNVSEWVQDCWNESYQGAPKNEKAWETADCSTRVLRGGSWETLPLGLRSADRFTTDATTIHRTVGLRLARTAP